MKKCLALAGLVVSSAAITITSPTASEQWDLSQTNTIRWDAAPADKENFNILLVDEFASGRPNQTIATNVAPSAHNYVIQNVQVPNATYGYIFVFVGTDARVNPGVIGNSAVFNVTKSGSELSFSPALHVALPGRLGSVI
ncbi:hypothetical protein GQ53DRAFT_757015 [Thozetella sp. PMI_491]|nr:hypothetical protein GQ53DRAFT_757015 [Thozetella sp. PMI_491]